MRILVVEDYTPLRIALVKGLTDAGYSVDAAANGREGQWQVDSGQHDVVVLDLMLPEVDGKTILQNIRADNSQVHVLVLTAKDAVADRVDLLNNGADDYLTKPFVFAEMLARVRALMRRKYGLKSPLIQVGDLEVNTSRREVRRGDHRIELTAREYALLEFLAFRSGEVVSRTDIWQAIYDFNDENQSNVVDVYISYLRKKIDRPGWPKLIHTRRGQGYLLAASV